MLGIRPATEEQHKENWKEAVELHAKGEIAPRQRQGVSLHKEDHDLSAEAGAEDAETALDHEDEERVLVDPYDDDGAVHSPGDKTPEATGAEAAATTEAAGVETLERLLYLRIAFGRGVPKSGTASTSGAT